MRLLPATLFAMILPALILAAAPAWAQKLKRGDPDCGSGVQSDLNACANASYRAADADLNRAYQRLIGPLSGAERTRLVEAQRAWLRYRDLECDSATMDSEGGSIRPMLVLGCMEHLTRQRTEELQARQR